MREAHYTDTARPAPLLGHLVLVTGGARRIGGVVSRHLGALGARVAVHCHTSEHTAQELVSELPAGSFVLQADLATADGASRIYRELDRRAESPDLFVHCAASFVRADLEASDAAIWDHALALNLRSFALVAREMVRRREASGGVMVAIADAAGVELWPNYLAHSVAKAGLIALVKSMARGLGPAFRVNAVVPGPVLPPEETTATERSAMEERTLVKRLGSPQDVARAVEFLVLTDFVTGASIHVTGGSELWRGKA